MSACAISGVEHGGIISPDAQRESIVAKGVRRDRSARQTAIDLLQPVIHFIYTPAECNQALNSGPGVVTRRGDDHHGTTRIGG